MTSDVTPHVHAHRPGHPPDRLPNYEEFLAFDNIEESESFDKLKHKCDASGLLDRPESLGKNESLVGINDNVTLLRFLRARSHDVAGAYTHFKKAIELHRAADMLAVYDNIDIAEYNEARQLYPYWSGRRTYQGLPLCIWSSAALTPQRVSAYRAPLQPPLRSSKTPAETTRALSAHDTLTRFVLPLCSAVRRRHHPDLPISSCLYVADISSLTLSQIWSLKGYVPHISGLLSQSYPEMLDRVYVVGAPSWFPKVWRWLEGWLDPVTAKKLTWLSDGEVRERLREVLEEKDIPVKYGGKFAWELGLGMSLDSELEALLEWEPGFKGFPDGPLKWVEEDGRDVIVACGTGDGVKRMEKVATLMGRADDN